MYSYIEISSQRTDSSWIKFVRVDSDGECIWVTIKMNKSNPSPIIELHKSNTFPSTTYFKVTSSTEEDFEKAYKKATENLAIK